MFFEVYNSKNPTSTEPPWYWLLVEGTQEKPGNPIAAAPVRYFDEAECRSAVATFRKSASGVKFAKVVTT
jgi:hypothetical protein